VKTVRSINGAWLRTVAKNTFPTQRPARRIEALADVLEISRRSCYAYVAEERRVPEEVEERFIKLFGKVAEDGWRTIEMQRPRTEKKRRETNRSALRKHQSEELRNDWRSRAINASSILSQDVLRHILDWEQNPMTVGQFRMIEEDLDEQEARERYPHGFDTLAVSEDWLAICKVCGMVGSVDDKMKEINGLVFKATCETLSHRIG
jgi:plasmid maintenance system antidote protein VapI